MSNTAVELAKTIVSTWDNWDNFTSETAADDALQSAINTARTYLVSNTAHAAWFVPVLEWHDFADPHIPHDSPNDYTMDEACAVLRAFIVNPTGECDVLAILNPLPWAMQRTAIVDTYQDVLNVLAANNGACLYWQMPDDARAKAACAAGVIAFSADTDLYVHPLAITDDNGQSYNMPKQGI